MKQQQKQKQRNKQSDGVALPQGNTACGGYKGKGEAGSCWIDSQCLLLAFQ